MNRFTVFAAVLVLVAGCRQSLRDYEVGELEEERVQQGVKPIAAGIERGDAELAVSTFLDDYNDPAFDGGTMKIETAPDGVSLATWSRSGQVVAMDREGMKAFFAKYIKEWKVASRALAKIREIVIAEDGETAEGRFFLDVYGLTAAGEAREDFIHIRTKMVKRGDKWRVAKFEFDVPYTCTWAAKAQFRNVSREVNAEWPHTPHPEARGYLPIPEQTADSGLACADFDRDGFYDLYLVNGNGKTLLRNRGDGTFEDVTSKAGVADAQNEGRGALFADLDNDGYPDLYLANNRSPNKLFRNKRNGTFTDITDGSGLEYTGFSTSVAAADYDRDGDLDLYQCCYGNFYEEFPVPPVEDGEPNRLYRNEGGMKFTEVGDEADVDDTGWTLAATWGDANNDGWPDLLVANDFGYKHLYINNGDGNFDDVAFCEGIEDLNFGMSAAFGDIDNDGDLDIYFSNMYSNTNWIFNRPELLPVPWFLSFIRSTILGRLSEMTRGNTLYINNGDGTWSNGSEKAGTHYGQWAWGSDFLDYDADGDLDIYCVNGFLSGADAEDL